jgi:chromate transporter
MNLLTFFLLALKASFFSFSGLGNVPSLHADLIARGWATERQFAESIAVGQVSPGPNGLWVVNLGYLIGGIFGALLALVAITIPPFLILIVERLYRRVRHHPAVEGFVRGLSLAVVGVFVTVMFDVLHSNGINGRSLLIALVSAGLGATKRVPVIAIIALAAVVGIVWR